MLVSYKELLVYEEVNEQSIFIPDMRKKFSVRELLDGVEDLSVRMERRENELGGKKSLKEFGGIQTDTQRRILRVVVASPGDVQPERDVLPSVVEEVNRGVAGDVLDAQLNA